MSAIECEMRGCQREPEARVLNDPTGVEFVCEKHARAAYHEGYEVRQL